MLGVTNDGVRSRLNSKDIHGGTQQAEIPYEAAKCSPGVVRVIDDVVGHHREPPDRCPLPGKDISEVR